VADLKIGLPSFVATTFSGGPQRRPRRASILVHCGPYLATSCPQLVAQPLHQGLFNCIVIRYNRDMRRQITPDEYRALAELRYLIRRFLQEGDSTIRGAGLEPQQYLLLLAIRGLPPGHHSTIRTLADRLSLRHHSTVELIDRMEAHAYVKRTPGREDRRQVLVQLLPRGEKLLEQVVEKRIIELRSNGRALVDAIGALLEAPRRRTTSPKKNPRKRAKRR
jgi:DNA-binding MarR family transcriptional regulator